MDYTAKVRKTSKEHGVLFLMFQADGLPTYFKNFNVPDFNKSTVDEYIQRGAQIAVNFWNSLASLPDETEVEEGYEMAGSKKPQIFTPRPSHSNTQYLVESWDERADSLVQTWTVVEKTDEQLNIERQTRRIAERSTPDSIVQMMEVIGKVSVADKLGNMPDRDLSKVAAMFPDWGPGMVWDQADVDATAVVNRKGTLYKVIAPHTSQADWLPEDNPSLYTPYRAPGSINAWVQPTGSQDAYDIGEMVRHPNTNDGGTVWVYRSKIAANTTEPGTDGTFDRYWEPVRPL